jgi:hypothetical protein
MKPAAAHTLPQPVNVRDAYEAALERERTAWASLLQVRRSDPRYKQLLSEWQSAADGITVAADKVLVRLPKRWPEPRTKSR